MNTVAAKRMKIRFLPFLCMMISIALLLAGLWPFNFFPENNVRWIPDQEVLRFGRHGIVSSPKPFAVPGETLDFRKPILFELKIRPLEEPSNSISRILSICDDQFRELFIVGQWKNHLIIRLANIQGSSSGPYRETGVDKLFRINEPVMLGIHSDNSGLSVFADGSLVLSHAGYSLSRLPGMRPQTFILLGNSPTGESPWEGDLMVLSIHQAAGRTQYPQADVMTFEQSSEDPGGYLRTGGKTPFSFFIPWTYRSIKNTVLFPPWKQTRFSPSYWQDVMVNILGFIPFGFVYYAWIKRPLNADDFPAALLVIVLGTGISLMIELLQVFLPTRDSSLTDVMSNSLGTYFGVFLARRKGVKENYFPEHPQADGSSRLNIR